ncbi:hypothetical protein LEMA_P038280.1 [Plenodomus lingam JN3]|uniref:Avirulence Effector AvrLm4-7 domain-containing protein n=1 Tax=Leptosphaeria maculans (strain JN3 / isolate v23.1.3 / race Av1-4-5-6-7-8) TaxID=985895 RepID=E4ZN68_LEPMJ|nr:hypothetical protein LEMA_P038280.1 [Plenodomus lingam JN3]CBX92927.1 hypothetical protein LEMA_P038280.1 [Plenodomus lingam JN3]
MQPLVPILFFANLLGLSSACSQYRIDYAANNQTCEKDAGKWRNLCSDLAYQYLQWTKVNGGRLGHDIRPVTYCNTCDMQDPRCYCSVSFMRLREWMGTTIPTIPDPNWHVDKSHRQHKISRLRPHCD